MPKPRSEGATAGPEPAIVPGLCGCSGRSCRSGPPDAIFACQEEAGPCRRRAALCMRIASIWTFGAQIHSRRTTISGGFDGHSEHASCARGDLVERPDPEYAQLYTWRRACQGGGGCTGQRLFHPPSDGKPALRLIFKGASKPAGSAWTACWLHHTFKRLRRTAAEPIKLGKAASAENLPATRWPMAPPAGSDPARRSCQRARITKAPMDPAEVMRD